MRRHFLFTLVLISTLAVQSQNFIRGKVLDDNNQPIRGAYVILKQTSRTVISDPKGEFYFGNLSDFAYTLQVKCIGYEDFQKNVQTGSDIQIVLTHISINLEEVNILATRATDRSPVAFSNVTKQKIEERNSGQDLPYLLAFTPSYITTSDAGTGIGYTGFRIRGSDANRTNVTVNGIPLNDSESHSVFFVNMPDFASSLHSVQVQRGVGTSSNGPAAFGASINMQTEVLNNKPYAEAGITVGSFNTLKNSVMAGTGMINNFAVDVRLSNIISDGYIDRASVDMKSYFISGGYYGENTLVKFITFGGKEKTYQAWNGVVLENHTRTYNELGMYTDNKNETKFYDNQTDNYNQTHYQLHFTQVINAGMNLNASLHYTRGKGYYEDYKTDRKYVEYGLTPATVNGSILRKTDLIRQKWLDNHFGGATVSLNRKYEKLSLTAGGAANKYFGDHYGKVIWVRYPNNAAPGHTYYFNESTKTDANIYAKLNYTITDRLHAYADFQYRFIEHKMSGEDDKYDADKGSMRDITQSHIFHFFNPKGGLNYQINKSGSLYASFAIANREPNRNNYTDAGPNEVPESERLYDTELGYRYLSNNLSLGANLYYMKYKGQLILTGKISDIGEMLTSNIPDSYRAGVELMAGLKITEGLRWDGNLNLSSNKIKNFREYADEYDAEWNRTGTKENFFKTTNISFSPNSVANSILSYSFKGIETAFYSTFVGRQYLDNTSDVNRSIDAYFVSNLRLGYSWKMKKIKSVDFNLLINNLFDTDYETNGYNWYTYYLAGERINEKRYFPQAGIHFLFSTAVKL